MNQQITPTLLAWYAEHGRSLPWRETEDPYAIWVAEVMLQQTRVETVLPYYRRWMRRFATVSDLAEASRDDVLNLWEGLGYYRRAVYLHQAAQVVVDEHDGTLPQTEGELRELPGIGPYTAAAIASIAFGADQVALDGNLRRVLARLFDVAGEVRSSETEARLRELGRKLLPPGRAGDFNQALMDLGATVCLPRGPQCSSCPLESHCLARERGVVEQRPTRPQRGDLPQVTRVSVVLRSGDRFLIARRPEGKLLGGLWEFPGGKLDDGEELVQGLTRQVQEELGIRLRNPTRIGTYRHSYTHYRVTAHAFRAELGQKTPVARERSGYKWVTAGALDEYPMGKIDRSIAQAVQAESAP